MDNWIIGTQIVVNIIFLIGFAVLKNSIPTIKDVRKVANELVFGDQEDKTVDDDYEIIHYPRTKKYYATYKGKFLKVENDTNIVTTKDETTWATSSKDVVRIKEIIEMHKEQTGKLPIEKYDPNTLKKKGE